MSAEAKPQDEAAPKPQKRRRGLLRRLMRLFCWAILLLVIAVLTIRPFMPRLIRNYVNRTLDQSQLYRGKIG